jgi:hypothetical protein
VLLVLFVKVAVAAPPAQQTTQCFRIADFGYRVGSMIIANDLTQPQADAAIRSAGWDGRTADLYLRIVGYVFASKAAPWADAEILYKACTADQLDRLLGARL